MANTETLPIQFQRLKNIYSEYLLDQREEEGEMVDVLRAPSAIEQAAFDQQTAAFVEGLIGSLIFSFRNDNHHLGSGTDPFFANLLAHCQREMDVTLKSPTMIGFDTNDQLVLRINALRFIGVCASAQEARDLIRHECFHLLFEHLDTYQSAIADPTRREWVSLATDVQINQNLNHMPQGSVTLEQVEETVGHALDPFESSYYYYTELKQAAQEERTREEQAKSEEEQNGEGASTGAGLGNESANANQEGDGKKPGGMSLNEGDTNQANDQNGTLTIGARDLQNEERHDQFQTDSDHRQLQENTVKQAIKDAYQHLNERQRGDLGSRVEQAVKAIDKAPTLDWRRLVKQGFGRLPRGYHATKKRMNRRQPERLDLSGRQVDHSVELLAFVDTSASMSEEELAYILGELRNIAQQLASPVKVIQTDNEIKRVDALNAVDMSNIMYKGRGGTQFTPAFEWLRQHGYNNHNSISVYFTDGFGETEGSLKRHGYRNMYWVLVGDSLSDLSVESFGRAYLLINDPKYVKSGLAKPNDKWKGGL
ncbi:MAG: VWA-like domain-containing protein [Aerococcus sp.]|nr:VWA-like domain-containing protein [Aerococcus sp.]